MSDALEREQKAMAERYARRAGLADRYSLLRPEVWQMVQERQRALLRLLAARGQDPAGLRLVEVGCGSGGNLLELLRIGFAPAHLQGVELLPQRLAQARECLPSGLGLIEGDACLADIAPASQDLVLQSTVFSSILDAAVQRRLAHAMWSWLRPGGAVLWYDFAFDNPRNPDVRGVPVARVRELFPAASAWSLRRVTLAPPLARWVCRLHPSAYTLFNALPLLRTHRLILIEKR